VFGIRTLRRLGALAEAVCEAARAVAAAEAARK
jgi:hypothetical protein